ncbi:MAG TPA: hypothetical protein VNJ53_13210 [Gaiellaceae bacterium]|nr:hypothetical protein [Gaiellaceae bacterium]
MLVIGIDPGLDGALAVLEGSGECLELRRTPTLRVHGRAARREYDLPAMAEMLRAWAAAAPQVCAAVERVHAMPRQGVRSMFRLGYGLGIWEALLAAYRIPYDLVAPQRWQRVMLADGPRGKGARRLRALKLFPAYWDLLRRRGNDGLADALLIAEYGRRAFVAAAR